MDTTAPVITCPSTAKTVQRGVAWTFDAPTATDNSGSNTISILSTVTNLTGHCGNTFDATRTWQATDACGNSSTCSQTVTVIDTTAIGIKILSPTNNTVFIAPAAFTILAEASDANGVFGKVEFFLGTNKVGEAIGGAPYFIIVTNVPAGDYTLFARATDGCGNTSTSLSVGITVLEHPPLTVISGMRFDPQTGLFDQIVRVSNPTPFSFDAVAVYVYGLTNATVYNASGTDNGVQYVQSFGSVANYVDFIIEYYVPSRIPPEPTLIPKLVTPTTRAAASGSSEHIERGVLLPDKTFLLEFLSISNRVYSIQYSSDLRNWKTAQPPIIGNGTHIQWIDNGQPKTESSPASQTMRFYRLLLLP